MRIRGGDRGAITVAAAGLPRGDTAGEDTRVRMFTGGGETPPTRVLAPRGRTHTRETMVAEPERRFKMLKLAPGEWQAAAPIRTFTPETPLQVAELLDITQVPGLLQVRVPATQEIFTAAREQQAEVDLHTTQTPAAESRSETITFMPAKTGRCIATIGKIQAGRKTRGVVGNPRLAQTICSNNKEPVRWDRCAHKISARWEAREVLAEGGGIECKVFTELYMQPDLSIKTGRFTSRNTIGEC